MRDMNEDKLYELFELRFTQLHNLYLRKNTAKVLKGTGKVLFGD